MQSEEQPTKDKPNQPLKTYLAIGIVVLVLVGLYFYSGRGSSTVGICEPGTQDVYVRALNTGLYSQDTIIVKAGEPVCFHFVAEEGSGCGGTMVIPDYQITFSSTNGQEAKAQFTPTKGNHSYSCPMRMFRGTLIAE